MTHLTWPFPWTRTGCASSCQFYIQAQDRFDTLFSFSRPFCSNVAYRFFIVVVSLDGNNLVWVFSLVEKKREMVSVKREG